jgi:SRSO17 transposase
MITSEREKEQAEQQEDLYQQVAEELADMAERMGPHFRRAEVRQRAARFLEGLLSAVERKNGWQLAEELGEHGPRGVQRLLGEADWDEEAVRDDLRGYVVEHLGEENAVFMQRAEVRRSWIERSTCPKNGRATGCAVGKPGLPRK